MKKLFLKLTRFWNEDRSLSIMLLLLFVFIFIFTPIMSDGKTGEILSRLIYSVMLITGILSVLKSKKYITIVIIFAVITFILNWVSEFEPITSVLIAHDIMAILFNSVFAFAILIKTFRAGEINFQRIQGSIVVYLLVGLIFAYAYHALYLGIGEASFNNLKGVNLEGFLYFSLTSLTTMGYGDITPIHPLARSIANLEALIGQLYPAILIARLVSMEFEASMKKKQKNH